MTRMLPINPRLLIVTQSVDADSPVFGFFHRWIEEFAKNCESLTVICLLEGEHNLPKNVRVFSLGKERLNDRPISIWNRAEVRVAYSIRFLLLIWNERKNYDAVFVHMNPEYIVLGGWLWRLLGKRIGLWYTHKQVNFKLRVAEFMSGIIWTASSESFRLATHKLEVMGHGIDVSHFRPTSTISSTFPRIISVSRISDTKRVVEILDVCDVLYSRHKPFKLTIIGSPATPADIAYGKLLLERISHSAYKDDIKYVGPIAHDLLPGILNNHDVEINLSKTGSLDKTVLEAMACGVRVVSTNIAFKHVLEHDGLFVKTFDPDTIADAVLRAWQTDATRGVDYIQKNHSLTLLIGRIVATLR